MFTAYPNYARYRTLRLTSPLMRGEDVYALQTALVQFGWFVATDGVLGNTTEGAIRQVQSELHITVDGLAGGGTQTAIVKRLAAKAATKHKLPTGLVFGQCSHESGCRLGNYSPVRPNGTYDAGVAQRNTQYIAPKDGFNAPAAIEALGANARKFYDHYVGVTDVRRRWTLAAGAWNAPAFANWIARQEGASKVPPSDCLKPGASARVTLEAYMASVTAYLVV